MARERSPERDKAFEIYQKHQGNIANREIANQLSISEKSISGWKCKDKWDDKLNGVLQKEIQSTPFNSEYSNEQTEYSETAEKDYFSGQCEAIGHKSGERCKNKALDGERFCKIHLDGWEGQCTAISKQTGERCKKKAEPGKDKCKFHGGKSTGPPLGSKNALTHGAYETIWMDQLDEDEQELVKLVVQDKIKSLEMDIQLLAIRERRMVKRIANLSGLDYTVVKRKYEEGESPMGHIDKESKEEQATLGQIQEIERELTKVQAEYTKKIALKHKMEMDIQDMELKREKLELEKKKVLKKIGDTNGSKDEVTMTPEERKARIDELIAKRGTRT